MKKTKIIISAIIIDVLVRKKFVSNKG
jgi:hypothetical protein